jgi:hypothetical protein
MVVVLRMLKGHEMAELVKGHCLEIIVPVRPGGTGTYIEGITAVELYGAMVQLPRGEPVFPSDAQETFFRTLQHEVVDRDTCSGAVECEMEFGVSIVPGRPGVYDS